MKSGSTTEDVRPVVLAGGSGTRLWPISRRSVPKQFCDFGGGSMFARTLRRIRDVTEVPSVVVCSSEHLEIVSEEFREAGAGDAEVLVEPSAAGTPCVASRSGGAVDAVCDGVNGVIVEDGSPESVATGIRRVVSGDGDFAPEAVRAFARRFAWPERAAAIERDVEEVVSRSRGGGERTSA